MSYTYLDTTHCWTHTRPLDVIMRGLLFYTILTDLESSNPPILLQILHGPEDYTSKHATSFFQRLYEPDTSKGA